MLGVTGFLIFALVIGFYAYSCRTNYVHVPATMRQMFVGGYGLLSLAGVVWAGAVLLGGGAVPALVFGADVLLVLATGCMAAVLVDLRKPAILATVALIGAALLTVRAFVVPPTAYTDGDLLHFNLSPAEITVVGLVFLAVWLPATLKVINLALATPALLPFRNLASFMFTAAILMNSFFLSARRPVMIIVTFASVILMFAGLGCLNIVLRRIDRPTIHRKARHG